MIRSRWSKRPMAMLLFSSTIGFMFRAVSYNTWREDSTCGDTRNKSGRMYDTLHDDVLFQVPTFRILYFSALWRSLSQVGISFLVRLCRSISSPHLERTINDLRYFEKNDWKRLNCIQGTCRSLSVRIVQWNLSWSNHDVKLKDEKRNISDEFCKKVNSNAV